MKRVFIFVLLIALIAGLSGCSKGNSAEARRICNFRKLYGDVDVGVGAIPSDIYVDTLTGILYVSVCGHLISGFSPIYNTDGTLKIWEGLKNEQTD